MKISSEDEEDYPIDPDKIAEVREFFMDQVREALENEFGDYIFLPEYDSNYSDIDFSGPF